MVVLKVLLPLISVLGAFKQISGASIIWYHYMTGQPLDQDHVILHYTEVGLEGGIRMFEKTYDGSQCYTDSNYSLKVVDGEPNYTLEKSMNNCKLYRIVVFHNETNEEPYKIVNVIVSNTFNLKSSECITTSGTYHVVMTKTRNPSVEDQQKISEDLENLGINGLKLTDLSVCPDPV
ncbi:uncharacterized protein LOC128175877 [Crassostrea angulata]|uniref:uncharacterized protein LOC128175877 n=1 Tax=Magallana angulata TaxID=2784310 RepID=UPI0022B0AB16|nr:uncharacterized protein LOC128175877 [Crassostrea angulata]